MMPQIIYAAAIYYADYAYADDTPLPLMMLYFAIICR